MAFVYSFFFCETATVPSLNPLRKRLRTTLKWDMRPVPVIFLRMAFSDQLQLRMRAPGNPHEAHVFFWMWKDDFPHRRHKVCVLLRRLPNELVPIVILLCLEVEPESSIKVLYFCGCIYLVLIGTWFLVLNSHLILLFILLITLIFCTNPSVNISLFIWESGDMNM